MYNVLLSNNNCAPAVLPAPCFVYMYTVRVVFVYLLVWFGPWAIFSSYKI